MFVKIRYSDIEDQEVPVKATTAHEHELLMNHDCPIKIILEYLRSVLKIDDEAEIDLCEENGTIKHLNEYVYSTPGTELLTEKTTYIVILLTKDDCGNCKIQPLIQQNAHQQNEFLNKIKRQYQSFLIKKK